VSKLKESLKELITTPQGWFSWFIANVISSLPWILPLIYGFLFKDNNGYLIAGSIWTFMMLPLTPFWILNLAIAVWLKNIFFKNKRVIIIEGDKTNGK
jgi:hypothetical protein